MKFLKWINDYFEETFMTIFIMIFTAASVLQVITRLIPIFGGSWTEEVARYSFIWMTFIGIAVASKKNLHVKIDILENFLKGKSKGILALLSKFVFFVFVVTCTLIGLKVCSNLIERPQYSPVLEINMVMIYAALPVGMALASVRQLQSMWHDIRDFKKELGVNTNGDNII